MGSTLIALVRMMSAIGATVLLHKFKRRPVSSPQHQQRHIPELTIILFSPSQVYLTAAGTVAFTLALLVGVTYEIEHHYFLSDTVRESYCFRMIPITAVVVLYCCTCFGYVNIPLAMAGEIFPTESKMAAGR